MNISKFQFPANFRIKRKRFIRECVFVCARTLLSSYIYLLNGLCCFKLCLWSPSDNVVQCSVDVGKWIFFPCFLFIYSLYKIHITGELWAHNHHISISISIVKILAVVYLLYNWIPFDAVDYRLYGFHKDVCFN